MKAQVSFEYYLSLTLFVLFVAYIVFQVVATVPIYKRQMKSELLMSEAYQLSELLVNDEGEPPAWSSVPAAKRIGLANRTNATNLVSFEKIRALNNSCRTSEGYTNVSIKLGVDNFYQFNISILDLNSGQLLVACYPRPMISRETVKTITRLAALDVGSYVSITVSMW
jgi:hypothetical protein